MTHDRAALAVFAKAPVPGAVKTRLAAGVGEARAVAIYRELARITARAVGAAGADRTYAYYAPAGGEAAVRELLGYPPWEFRVQVEGDLGARMSAAMDEMHGECARAVIVGTDCPALDERGLASALARLREVPLVLGPATDGGYYLVGLARRAPELFAGIPWSTSEVLAFTLERARAAGLTWSLLEPLADIDTEVDWRAWREARA